jgi:adenine phosphoribosyltransferase
VSDDLRDLLRAGFGWTDPGDGSGYVVSNRSGWWRDPQILAGLGEALGDLFRDAAPTVVVSPEVTGFLVGPLVARAIGAGFVEAYRAGARRPIAEPMTWATVPSDHRGDQQQLGVRDGLVRPADRVLVVDDWAVTGAQARALRSLFPGSHERTLLPGSHERTLLPGTYVGTAVIVDECPPEVSAELGIRGLLTGQDLR